MENKPLIVTHRGDRKRGVENTINACDLALANGANALEIDIRQTGSGEIVVVHDYSLKRLFNRAGYVGRESLAMLKNYPYISDKNNEQYIETLDSFLDHYKAKIPINLDAKTIHFFDFEFADRIISAIKNHNLFHTVWVSCFNPFLLQILKLKNKQIKTGYLFQRLSWLHTTYDFLAMSDAWHPHFKVVNEWLMNQARKRKKEVYVWTVNDDAVLSRLMQYEINGFIGDDVNLLTKGIKNN